MIQKMWDKTIFINGGSQRITDDQIKKIAITNDLFNEIEDSKIWITNEDDADKWSFLNVSYMFGPSDIIDISLVITEIKQIRRISKINDILK